MFDSMNHQTSFPYLKKQENGKQYIIRIPYSKLNKTNILNLSKFTSY